MILAEVNFTAAPELELVLWTIYCFGAICAGVIAVLKHRWGLVVLGLLTAGIPWFYAAVRPPMPNSVWARMQERRRGRVLRL